MTRVVWLLLAALLALVSLAGYRLLRSGLEADIYRERLAALGQDYAALVERYNEAVRRTAVTELVVEDGALRVVVRTAEGVVRSIPTRLDPSREIYVDYVVLDGRLWIRRVFDGGTPPAQALVIDPDLAQVDWDRPGAAHGKAAYRQLGEGRWVVTVTGDGALGLGKLEPGQEVPLSPPPPVREYRPVESEVDRALDDLAAAEVLRALARQLDLLPRGAR